MKTLLAALVVGLAVAAPGRAVPGEDPQPPDPAIVSRPAPEFLRQREDWSGLAALPADQRRGLDRIKYVPLDDEGVVWASFGGSSRLRVESWRDFAFLTGDDSDDVFALWRARLHGDLHIGEVFRVFVEGKTALASDRDLPGGRRTADVDTLALQQAFIDVRVPLGDDASFTLRPGRQMYQYGAQRLVSPLPWANTLRTWDGITGILQAGGWQADGFASWFAPVKKHEFNSTDDDAALWGLYASGAVPGLAGPTLDLYFLGTTRGQAAFNGTAGGSDRYTVGGRVSGALADCGIDYDLEGAYQFGRVGDGDVSAWMLGTKWTWTLPEEPPLDPRLFVGFDAGSGDHRAGGSVQTFDQLYPLGHAYLGFADLVARQNILSPFFGLQLQLLEKLGTQLAFHMFWREDEDDGVYAVSGALLRAPGGSSSREVAQELDLTFTYKWNRHLSLLAGYSHVFPGRFIERTGPDSDIDFGYAQVAVGF